jgi:hypothetical protein
MKGNANSPWLSRRCLTHLQPKLGVNPMKTNRLENPCRPGSAARRIVDVLLSSRKRSLAATEIAFRAKIATPTVKQVVAALRNEYHNARIAKTGLSVHRAFDGGFFLAACKPNPSARRPQSKQVADSPLDILETMVQ